MTKRQTKISRERSAIVAELSLLSRVGWSSATRDDYATLEDRLREIDDKLRRDDELNATFFGRDA